jgi:hypothetical protein
MIDKCEQKGGREEKEKASLSLTSAHGSLRYYSVANLGKIPPVHLFVKTEKENKQSKHRLGVVQYLRYR